MSKFCFKIAHTQNNEILGAERTYIYGRAGEKARPLRFEYQINKWNEYFSQKKREKKQSKQRENKKKRKTCQFEKGGGGKPQWTKHEVTWKTSWTEEVGCSIFSSHNLKYFSSIFDRQLKLRSRGAGVCVCVPVWCVLEGVCWGGATHCNAKGNAWTATAHLPVGAGAFIPFVYVPSVKRECEGQQMKCCCPVAKSVLPPTIPHARPSHLSGATWVLPQQEQKHGHCVKKYVLNNVIII